MKKVLVTGALALALSCCSSDKTAVAQDAEGRVDAPASLSGAKFVVTGDEGVTYTIKFSSNGNGMVSARGVTEYTCYDWDNVPLTRCVYRPSGSSAELSLTWEIDAGKYYISTLTSADNCPSDKDEFSLPPAKLVFTDKCDRVDTAARKVMSKSYGGYLIGNEVNTNLSGKTVNSFNKRRFSLEFP